MTDVRDGVKVTWPGVPSHFETYIHCGESPGLVIWDDESQRHVAIWLVKMTQADVCLAVNQLLASRGHSLPARPVHIQTGATLGKPI